MRASRPASAAPTPVVLHLGIDFGTRYTKVCFRDLGRERSGVVTFAATRRPRLGDAILRSYVELAERRVITGLTDAEWDTRPADGSNAVGIDFIKMRLAQVDLPGSGDGWKLAAVEGCSGAAEVEALTAFFLARVIDRSCRSIMAGHRELFIGRVPQWSFSVGVPVQYRDSAARARFERVLRIAAAWSERGLPECPALEEVRSTVRDLAARHSDVPCSVVSEIGAAIRSFIASPRALEGVYLYFDVGAGTLDGASFRFHRPREARPLVDFYSGEVEELGLAAIASRIASAGNRSADDIEEILVGDDPRSKLSGALDVWRTKINQLVARVIIGGRRVDRAGWSAGLEELAQAFHRRRRVAPGQRRTVPLFVGGGASLSPFYRDAILSTYEANRLEAVNVKPYALEELPFPGDLDMAGLADEHYRRFAVAYGLSFPPEESPDEFLPSDQSPDAPKAPSGPRGVPDYHDTKDLV